MSKTDIDKLIEKMDNSSNSLRENLSDIDHDYKLDVLSGLDRSLESLREDFAEESRKNQSLSRIALFLSAATLVASLLSLWLSACR